MKPGENYNHPKKGNLITAHDALGDILVLEKLFERLFIKMSKDIGPAAVDKKMIEISSKPVLLSRM